MLDGIAKLVVSGILFMLDAAVLISTINTTIKNWQKALCWFATVKMSILSFGCWMWGMWLLKGSAMWPQWDIASFFVVMFVIFAFVLVTYQLTFGTKTDNELVSKPN